MRNLTLKKVALGVFLAGFAASSAYAAALSATSASTIQGTAPYVSALSVAGTAATQNVDVVLYQADGTTALATGTNLAIGDYIAIKYKTEDVDGDTESALGKETAKTVVFFYSKDAGLTWTQSIATDVTAVMGEVKWKIPAGAVGANKVGFKIQGNTQFGDPRSGLWLNSDDITNAGAIGQGPTDPGTNPGTGGGTGGGSTGTGPSVTVPIDPSATYEVRILFVSNAGVTTGAGNEYQVGGAGAAGRTPKLGDVFEAKVFDTAGGVATDKTSDFSAFNWYLTGDNSAANGTFAVGDYSFTVGANPNSGLATSGPKNATVQLPSGAFSSTGTFAGLNGATVGTNHAGAQGFKLGVSAQ